MKRLSMLWAITLIVSGLTALTGCSSNDEDTPVQDEWESQGLKLTRETGKQNAKTIINYFEQNGIKWHLIDITERFSEARFLDKSVPVSHVEYEKLPTAIQPIAKGGGRGFVTKVFRMVYRDEVYYEITNPLQSTLVNIYNVNGERYDFCTVSFDDFMSEAKGLCCILVLDTEIVKSAEGAPNYLVGIWQNDWQHVKHLEGEAFVNLYPDLPFSITEVMRLNDDFTGYLRTIKTYRDGRNEVALDPFRYELTDYHGGEQYGYHGYSYKCFFEAGDVIEYAEFSYDGMQTLGFRSLAYFPWFKQAGDQFESLEVNVGRKYGLPTKDENNPIIGRWTGGEYSEYLMKNISTTWVFRSDNTGYRLLEGTYDVPFAYTVSYNGSDAEVTIYKYNTGFTFEEGFARNIADLSFDSTILPKGTTIKARLNGNSLELDGWGCFSRQE